VDEFNAVLTRNADMVQRARTQAGNLAHAVKTPLAILENAAHGEAATHSEADALRRLVGEQVELARRHIDWHLAHARAAAAGQASGTRTPLTEALPPLIRTMRRLYASRALDIQLKTPGDLAVKGEAQDVQEMLGNLLDNACKWARHSVVVTAHCAPRSDSAPGTAQVTLDVDDDGPGLSAPDVARAFERGVRLDERQPGAGLGLSIVAEMAALYQGSIEASASPLGGLRMRLRLPAA